MLSVDPPKFDVQRLIDDDDDDVSDVHWFKMRRLVGPNYVPTEEDVTSALHDRQKFKMDYFVDWMEDDDRGRYRCMCTGIATTTDMIILDHLVIISTKYM